MNKFIRSLNRSWLRHLWNGRCKVALRRTIYGAWRFNAMRGKGVYRISASGVATTDFDCVGFQPYAMVWRIYNPMQSLEKFQPYAIFFLEHVNKFIHNEIRFLEHVNEFIHNGNRFLEHVNEFTRSSYRSWLRHL